MQIPNRIIYLYEVSMLMKTKTVFVTILKIVQEPGRARGGIASEGVTVTAEAIVIAEELALGREEDRAGDKAGSMLTKTTMVFAIILKTAPKKNNTGL
jgi:hypothetical protein